MEKKRPFSNEVISPELQKEVDDFITFLIEKNKPKIVEKKEFSWRGALKDQKPNNSVEMQHEIQKNWDEHVST